ncbi:MAG TPA: methyltransferase domain-containing protein, partial [Candidatus Omnitrophota bacterium]|nr:methyltransferase domain-containing protein [Candidatus Omnitrophota bacterium]
LEGRPELKDALSKAADIMYEVSEGRSRWPEYDQWRLVKWHGYTHAADLALKSIEAMKNIRAAEPSISPDAVSIAAIACMYHDIGYYRHDEEGFGTLGVDHEKRSMDFVRQNHEDLGLTAEDAKLVNIAILPTQLSFDPSGLENIEAESYGDYGIKGAVCAGRILGTLDIYDTREEMLNDPVRLLGMLREEYRYDMENLRKFVQANIGSAGANDPKMKKASLRLSALESMTMSSDEDQLRAAQDFYTKIADRRVAIFGVWGRFISKSARDDFEAFREELFKDGERRDVLIRNRIYTKEELLRVRTLFGHLMGGESLGNFSAYEKLDIWKYMVIMNMPLRDDLRSRSFYAGKPVFKALEDEIKKLSINMEVADLFIGYEWTDRLSSRSKTESLERNVNVGPGTRMLDIGCGRGNLVIDLAVKNPDAEFVGIDANPYNLAHAVTRLVDMGDKAPLNVRFHMRDCRSPLAGKEVPKRGVPYPDDEFDIVSLFEGVMDEASFREPWQGLLWEEAVRVAKKDGGNIVFFGLTGERAFKPSLPDGVYAQDQYDTFFVIDGKKTKYYYPPWTREEDPSPYRRDKCELCVWKLTKNKPSSEDYSDDQDIAKTGADARHPAPEGQGSQMDMFVSLQSQNVIRESDIGKPVYPGDGPGGASILDLPVKQMEEA